MGQIGRDIGERHVTEGEKIIRESLNGGSIHLGRGQGWKNYQRDFLVRKKKKKKKKKKK